MKINNLFLPKSDLIKGFKQSILTVCWEYNQKAQSEIKTYLEKLFFVYLMKLVSFWDVLIVRPKDENKLKWLHNIPILSHNFLQDTNMCVYLVFGQIVLK